jgi:hypothetical protein
LTYNIVLEESKEEFVMLVLNETEAVDEVVNRFDLVSEG